MVRLFVWASLAVAVATVPALGQVRLPTTSLATYRLASSDNEPSMEMEFEADEQTMVRLGQEVNLRTRSGAHADHAAAVIVAVDGFHATAKALEPRAFAAVAPTGRVTIFTGTRSLRAYLFDFGGPH